MGSGKEWGHLNPVFDLWQYPAATARRLRFRDYPRSDKGLFDESSNRQGAPLARLGWFPGEFEFHRKAVLTGG